MDITLIGKIQEHNNESLEKDSKFLWITLTDNADKKRMENIIESYNKGVIKYGFSYFRDYPNMKLKITIPKRNKEHNIYNYSSMNLIKMQFKDWYKYDVKITVRANKRSFKTYKNNVTECVNIVYFSLKKIELMEY